MWYNGNEICPFHCVGNVTHAVKAFSKLFIIFL